MSEYIKREAVEKAIDSVYSDLYPEYVPNSIAAFRECLLVDIGIIPAADVQSVDRWISVNDKLPEVGQRVLIVYITWSGKYIGIAELPANYKSLDYPVMNMDGNRNILLDRVTRWQPLPELPEE